MANKLHKDLTGEELHNPKGFDEASIETALVKNIDGDLEFRLLSELGATGPQGPQGPDATAIDNVVIVNKVPGPGQFSTITAALASITDASDSNRYHIRIGPGTYVEDTLVMKGNVFLIGSGRATILQPDVATKNIILGVDSSSIRDLVLEGATGSNAAAIFMSNGPSGSEFNAEKIIFRSNYHFARVDSTGGNASIVLVDCEPGLNAVTVQPFIVTGTGTGLIRVTNFTGTMENALLAIEDFFRVSASGNKIIASNVIIILGGSATGDHGLHIDDGATALLNCVQFNGFDRGLFAANVGAAPTLIGASVTLLNSGTEDINIEHTGAMGGVQGAATSSKVSVHATASFSLSLVDPDPATTVGSIVLGDIVQADRYDRLINLSKLGRAASTMGLFSGGDLSDGGGLNTDVAAGSGFLVDSVGGFVKEVTWNAATLTIASESSVYIFVNTNGTVSQSSSLPDLSQNIVLGRVSTLSADLHFIQRTAMDMHQYGNKVSEFQREAFGAIYAFGSLVAENSGTDRALDIGSGSYWFSTKNFMPSGGTVQEFSVFYRQAVSGFNVVTGATQVSNSQYDDGSGTLQSLGAGKFAKHSLYVIGDGADEQYFLVISQAQYDTQVEAEGATIPTPPSSFDDAVALIATIIVQQGQTNLISIIDNRPVLGFKASGVSASANHGNLLGLSGDDHQQYLLANGGRAMSGNLDMGGNNVVSVGTVDGVDVSAHAARHLPGGSDALSTGVPVDVTKSANAEGSATSLSRSDHKHNVSTGVAVEITDSTNAEGSATSLARSDHTHSHGSRGGGSQHAAATTSVAGFMSAADKTKLDGLPSTIVFGSQYQAANFTGNSAATADPTFNQVHRLTTPSIPAGTYRIAYTLMLSRTAATGRGIARVQVDDSINVLTRWEGSVSNTSSFLVVSGYQDVVLTAAVHNIDVDLSSSGAGQNTIANTGSTVSIFRVA